MEPTREPHCEPGKMPEILLSVIVPCYNVEGYLRACLDGAVQLPPDRVEILCINDCSPDHSAEILAEYAAKYPHVRVLTNEVNRGLSATRNLALDQARGEYVHFFDSDDIIHPEAEMRMVELACQNKLDILQPTYVSFQDVTDRVVPTPMPPASGVMTGDACFAEQCAQGTFTPMTVVRLFRRAFLAENNLRMAEGFLFEDELFTPSAFLLAKRVQVSGELMYRYRLRGSGIMSGFSASTRWCGFYMKVAALLTERSESASPTPGQRALRQRAASIALSVPKNIVAYGLAGEVRRDALAFAREHRREIVEIAKGSGSASLRAQGMLLQLSLPLYLRLYPVIRRVVGK